MTTTLTPPRTTPQRRSPVYRGYDLLLENAERIAAGQYVTVGDWTYAQILDHLARSFEASIDGVGDPLPAPVRLVGGFFMKGRLLNKTLPVGYRFPGGSEERLAPDPDIDVETALEKFRQACHRCMSERQRSLHPLLGRLDRAEWDRFNLRHAELHMSYVVPIEDADAEEPSPDREPVGSHA
jgi:hypothetical protein